jgi:hypothetical protein
LYRPADVDAHLPSNQNEIIASMNRSPFAAMDRTKPQSRIALPADMPALLIGAGLATLLASTWIPTLPVITALAVLALGATYATIARFRRSPALMPVLLLHAITYTALYGLFIGATFHAAASVGQSIGVWHALDLVASALVMTITLQRTGDVLSRG